MTDPWQDLSAHAARLEADQGFSGILRVTRGGSLLWESCHGMANRADGIPVRRSTRFATASLSKAFTAVGVLDAIGRGEVGLHDPVVDVLPAEKRPRTLRPDVTVHHLLSHTSGIADYFEEDEDLPGYQEDYAALWKDLPSYSVRDYVTLLPLFSDLPPVRPPGQEEHYSNAGYVLLGILLAHVSGLPFGRAVESRIFAPAGMSSSGYLAIDEVHPDVATGYLPPAGQGGPWRTNIYSVPAVGGGDGGALVTAEDAERFVRAVNTGGVWRGVAREDLLTPRSPGRGRWSTGYGIDIRADGVFGQDGSDPGTSALVRYGPSTDTTVVLLANIEWDDVAGLAQLVNDVVDAALPAT